MGMAYLSGLLSNFGYLVLAHTFPPHYSLICRYMECNPHFTHDIIEQHVVGVTREQIVSWLMGAWNMPEEITNGLRWQMNPNYTGEMSVYANLLFLTNHILRRNGIGDGPVLEVPEHLFERLGLEESIVEEISEEIAAKTDDLKQMAKQMA